MPQRTRSACPDAPTSRPRTGAPRLSAPRLAVLFSAVAIAVAAALPAVGGGSDEPAEDVPVRAAAAGPGITEVHAAEIAEPVLPPRDAPVAEVGDRSAEEPEPEGTGEVLSGMASWYGPGFAGQQTANGEIYDPSQLTAAHRTLAFGTQLRVTNLETGASVVVRINDRGPYVGGRILDLSEAAASTIGLKASGVAPVEAEIL